mmetsp:Transcript_38028/g.104603  ORF Transcript_38028/g.104603 Transcript_38028/m.104603 type:complete len:234 (+) Transcript_38028:171-872(+)
MPNLPASAWSSLVATAEPSSCCGPLPQPRLTCRRGTAETATLSMATPTLGNFGAPSAPSHAAPVCGGRRDHAAAAFLVDAWGSQATSGRCDGGGATTAGFGIYAPGQRRHKSAAITAFKDEEEAEKKGWIEWAKDNPLQAAALGGFVTCVGLAVGRMICVVAAAATVAGAASSWQSQATEADSEPDDEAGGFGFAALFGGGGEEDEEAEEEAGGENDSSTAESEQEEQSCKQQ